MDTQPGAIELRGGGQFEYTTRSPHSSPARPAGAVDTKVGGARPADAVVVGTPGEEIVPTRYGRRLKVPFTGTGRQAGPRRARAGSRCSEQGRQGWGAIFIPGSGRRSGGVRGGRSGPPGESGKLTRQEMPPLRCRREDQDRPIQVENSSHGGGHNEIRIEDSGRLRADLIHGEKDLEVGSRTRCARVDRGNQAPHRRWQHEREGGVNWHQHQKTGMSIRHRVRDGVTIKSVGGFIKIDPARRIRSWGTMVASTARTFRHHSAASRPGADSGTRARSTRRSAQDRGARRRVAVLLAALGQAVPSSARCPARQVGGHRLSAAGRVPFQIVPR